MNDGQYIFMHIRNYMGGAQSTSRILRAREKLAASVTSPSRRRLTSQREPPERVEYEAA